MSKIPEHIFLYNPTSELIKLRDLGVEIPPTETIDLRRKNTHITQETWSSQIGPGGKLAELIKARKLIMSYEDRRFSLEAPEQIMPALLIAKPFPRRGLTVMQRVAKQSDFIEKIQAEFSGDSILSAPESSVAKNTSTMINNIDFDGFDDPLKDE